MCITRLKLETRDAGAIYAYRSVSPKQVVYWKASCPGGVLIDLDGRGMVDVVASMYRAAECFGGGTTLYRHDRQANRFVEYQPAEREVAR